MLSISVDMGTYGTCINMGSRVL